MEIFLDFVFLATAMCEGAKIAMTKERRRKELKCKGIAVL